MDLPEERTVAFKGLVRSGLCSGNVAGPKQAAETGPGHTHETARREGDIRMQARDGKGRQISDSQPYVLFGGHRAANRISQRSAMILHKSHRVHRWVFGIPDLTRAEASPGGSGPADVTPDIRACHSKNVLAEELLLFHACSKGILPVMDGF